MNNLNQQLTQAIDALIPEAELVMVQLGCMVCYPDVPGCSSCLDHKEPLLRHVLWALGDDYAARNITGDCLIYNTWNKEEFREWNLKHNLCGQSDELRQWLLELLSQSP